VITGTILALTLNEFDGVNKLLRDYTAPAGWRVLVVDGGSTDGTLELCDEIGLDYIIQSEPGVRHAYFSAWEEPLGDYVISISPDGNCDLDKIPLIIEKLSNGYDLVIGSRYLGDSKSEDDDLVTAFGNWVYNRLFLVLFQFKITDCMVIYRGYRTNLPNDLGLFSNQTYSLYEKLFSTKISWEPVMSARAAKRSLRISEIEAGEPKRIGGVRKLQIFRWGFAYLLQFILEATIRRKE
jgi:glycosyltransferase involved in cell wall biosynthesis